MPKYTNNRTGQAFTVADPAPLDKFDQPTISRAIRHLEGLSNLPPQLQIHLEHLRARLKELRKANPTPKAGRSTYDPTDVTSTESEIRRISAKGDSRSLAEDRHLRTLQSRAAQLNAAKVEADVAAVRAAEEKVQSKRRAAATPGGIDPVRATPGELRDGALAVIERTNRLTSTQQDRLDTLVRESTENRDAATVSKWVLLTESAGYRSAFWKAMAYEHPLWSPQEGRAVELWRQEFRSEIRAASRGGIIRSRHPGAHRSEHRPFCWRTGADPGRLPHGDDHVRRLQGRHQRRPGVGVLVRGVNHRRGHSDPGSAGGADQLGEGVHPGIDRIDDGLSGLAGRDYQAMAERVTSI